MSTVEKARAVPFWLAYRVSHLSGDGHSETREHLLDADTDPNVLRERVNSHFALPKILRSERNDLMQIPAFARSSPEFQGQGGGAWYRKHIELREAPILATYTCGECDGRGTIGSYGPKCESCGGAGIK